MLGSVYSAFILALAFLWPFANHCRALTRSRPQSRIIFALGILSPIGLTVDEASEPKGVNVADFSSI